MISWAEGVISVVEPLITCEGSESGVVFGAGLIVLDSPSHATDGLNNLSKKILGGTGSRLAPMRARISAAWLFSLTTRWNYSPSNRADILRTALR